MTSMPSLSDLALMDGPQDESTEPGPGTATRPTDLARGAGKARDVGQGTAREPVSEPVASANGAAMERTGTRPMFTITDAATACAVSRKTITRKLTDLSAHGAAKDDDGVWRIPVEALLAIGLHPGRSLAPSAPRPRVSAPVASPEAAPPVVQVPATAAPALRQVGAAADPGTGEEQITVSRQRWDDLRIRLARAEAEASERSLALADARLALRAITAGPGPSAAAPPAHAVPAMQPALLSQGGGAESDGQSGRRRRWWRLN